MSSNDNNNIEKRSFEAFVSAIGSEIEQAQVRLISAANAQMLFHYWKMGNCDTVQLSRKERIFGTQPYLYVPIRKVVSIERTTMFY